MKNYQTITNELERLGTIKALVDTYEVVAATSMRRIRNSVLENRAFHLGLNLIFQEVRRAHQKELRRLIPRRKSVAQSWIYRNGKTVFVFLSANTGLYGDIVFKIFSKFLEESKHNKADIVVIGRVGEELFKETMSGRPHVYFDFPDTRVRHEDLAPISSYLNQYEKVIVFHGVFGSLILQRPESSNISGDILPSDNVSLDEIIYIFEPSLESVAVFFETEIFSSLLEQVFNESRLAKLASRLILLDRSSTNIDRHTKLVTGDRRKIRHIVYNRKQLDAIGGLSLWDTRVVN